MTTTWEDLIKEYHTGTFADDLTEYDGWICDAVSELADLNVSIYTSEQRDFALENTEITAQAVNEFGLEPCQDFGEYVARAGALAWYIQNEAEIYGNLENGIALCVIYELKKEHGDEALNPSAWEYVLEAKECEWDDSSERIEDVTAEALRLYDDYIEANGPYASPID